jgi:inner membrane protein
MPSPVAHSLTGYAIYRISSEDALRIGWRTIFMYSTCSILPDLDFIPGFLIDEPNRFHHGISHSLGFAFVFGFLISLLLLITKSQSIIRNFFIFFSLYYSHVLLDLLSDDTSPPYGVPALWPVTDNYYISPISAFLDIHRASISESFITSLFNLHNFLAIFVEFIIFLPLVVIVTLIKRKRKRLFENLSENQ